MANDNELVVKLTANAEGFIKNIQSASGSWTGLLKTMSGGNVAMLAAGGAIIAAGAALWGLVKSSADAGDKMNELSEKTGVSVESLSLLKYAAEQSDTDIESLANGLKFLKKNLIDAQKPTSEQATIFKSLGIDTVDLTGKTRSQTDVMLDLADRFKDMQDPALKTKVALELFGKAGVDLIPMLNDGSVGIEALTAKAKELGLEMSGESAAAGNEFNDALNTLWATISALGRVIGEQLLVPIADLINFITGTAIPILKTLGTGVFAALTTIVYGLAEGFMSVYGAVAKITDAIGITKGAADGADDIIKGLQKSSSEWGKKADDAFKAIITGAPLATKGMTDTRTETQKNKKVTDAHVASILNKKDIEAAAAKASKENADKEAKDLAIVKKGIDNILDAKTASKDFDDEYFKYYAEQLKLEGKNEEQVAAIILAKKKELNNKLEDDYEQMLDDKHAADKKDLEKYLMVKGTYNQYDEDYFVNYRKLLEMQSSDSDEINIGMANEAIRVGHERAEEEVAIVVTTNDLMKTAIQGVADSIKGIWGGTTQTMQDVFHGALDSFVDIMAQMVIQAATTGAAIEWTMAAATAGISLVIGMLSMALGGKGKSIKVEPITVRLKKVFDDFVKDFRGATGEFQERLFPKKEEAGREISEIDKIVKELNFLSSTLISKEYSDKMGPRKTFGLIESLFVELAKKLSENLTDITSLIVERFNKIKDIVGDILDLYKRQGEFTKDMDKTIIDVQRSLFSPEQTFKTSISDASLLKGQAASATGEDKLSLLDELKSAYLGVWENAKSFFTDIASKIESLVSSKSGFAAGIDDAIKGVQRSTLSVKDIFSLQQQDITNLKQAVEGAIGEDKVALLNELKQAYTDSWSTAQQLFSPISDNISSQEKRLQEINQQLVTLDSNSSEAENLSNEAIRIQSEISGMAKSNDVTQNKLLEWQDYVVKGLEGVKDSGVSEFDRLIKIQEDMLTSVGTLNDWQGFIVDGLQGVKDSGITEFDAMIDAQLDMLGLQRSGVDLQTQMTSYLSSLDTNIVSTLKAIEEIGTTNTATDTQLSLLTTTLASLFDIPMMAAGGVVARPTLAMIGESGPEAVIPLNKLNQTAGGAATFNMSFPNVTDLRGMTVGQAESLIKNVFSQAAENLNRRGYRWPMQPRQV